ncbi:MAG: ABC transporter substrate-binding protein [Promethearchaeota archaeon]
MKKRILIVVGLGILFLNLFSLGGTINKSPHLESFSNDGPLSSAADLRPLHYTVNSLGYDLDPQFAWDFASMDVIEQVCEGLFGYNLSTPNLEIIPKLAMSMGTWNATGTSYTVDLRQWEYFHDGSLFDAWAVKWNFDRLLDFIGNGTTQISELYQPLESLYPATPNVIKEVEVLSTYQVKFHLNYPFAAFESLLCFSGSYMVSPASTPYDAFLQTGMDILVGTGPFRYVENDGTQLVFKAYANYWDGAPEIQEMHWIVAEFAQRDAMFYDRETDMLDSYNADYYDLYAADPTVTASGEIPSLVVYHLSMNNKQINRTIRQAISNAVNYSWVVQDLRKNSIQLQSPIPEGMMFHDGTLNKPVFDIINARQILVNAGSSHGLTMGSTDQDWRNMALADPIADLNYSYNEGNLIREDLGVHLEGNLELIGIDMLMNELTWPDYLDLLMNNKDGLSLSFIGWGADYNDPSNVINPLYSNASESNFGQVNDSVLQGLIDSGLVETDPVLRQNIYDNIQQYIVEDLMPYVLLYQPVTKIFHRDAISNYQYNALDKVAFSSCSYDPDSDFDELRDLEEFDWNTDPYHADTDRDGLTDGEEVIVQGTDPLLMDTDGDHLSDGDEVNVYGSDPLETDTDLDGLDDYDEVLYHTDLLNIDSDGDGLTDGDEVHIYRTDPAYEDTDHDGLWDGAEIVIHNTDPLLWDTYNDNLGDNFELTIGTDPLNSDSDLDGFYDGTEVELGTNPLDAGSYPGQTTTTDPTTTDPTSTTEPTDEASQFFKGIPGYSSGFLILSLFSAVFVILLRKQPRR